MAPSAVKSTSANHFEATYEAPFLGINNSSDPSDIAVNEFADCTGIITQSNRLTTAAIQNFRANQTNFSTTLFPTTPVGNEQIISLFKCSGFMCAVDQYLKCYIWTEGGFIQDQSLPGLGPFSFYTINVIGNIVLIGVPDPTYTSPFVAIYQPTAGIAAATTYVTGLYVGEISGYAIQLNSQQPSDNPQVNVNRLSWSAPFEYSTWNPLVGGIPSGAGFDVISDSPESLTGFSAHGNVGYIYRPNGLTQITLTGVGAAPFDLTPLTQGELGIGCKYGETLIQFGGTDFFVAESGVYCFSSQFQNISEKAWNGIYASIASAFQQAPSVEQYAGLILLYLAQAPNVQFQYVPSINGWIRRNGTSTLNPIPQYCLMIPTAMPNVTNPGNSDVSLVCWMFDVKSQSWYKLTLPSLRNYLNLNYPLTGDIRTNITATIQAFPWYNAPATQTSGTFEANTDILSDEMCYVVQVVYNTQNHPFTFFTQSVILYINSSGVLDNLRTTTNPMGAPSFSITFREEQVKLKRQVTISRVIIKAAGFGSIVPTITGIISPEYPGEAIQNVTVTGTPIAVNSSTPANYTSSLIFTGENPQLSLSDQQGFLNPGFDGYIVKVMMVGTYAEGDID